MTQRNICISFLIIELSNNHLRLFTIKPLTEAIDSTIIFSS